MSPFYLTRESAYGAVLFQIKETKYKTEVTGLFKVVRNRPELNLKTSNTKPHVLP